MWDGGIIALAQPPQPPYNDAADDSHHTAPNAHNDRPRTQMTVHEPKRPLTDKNDHAESRCHVTDGNVATKWQTMTLVVVRRSCLVSHGTLVPTSLTDNQTTNDNICCHSGARDDNTAGRHRDYGTTTRQERRTMTHQHATAKPCDDTQQRWCDNTRRQQRGTTTRCQHRTMTDHPHVGMRLTTPFSIPLLISIPIPFPFPSTSSPSLQHPPFPSTSPLPFNIPLPSLQNPSFLIPLPSPSPLP